MKQNAPTFAPAVPALDPMAPAPSPSVDVVPVEGGSYQRLPDGSLERVGGTEPAPARATTTPGALADETE